MGEPGVPGLPGESVPGEKGERGESGLVGLPVSTNPVALMPPYICRSFIVIGGSVFVASATSTLL